MVLKRSEVKIFTTNEYFLFKEQEGNRSLSKSNIKKLKDKISVNNMLKYHPILVNHKMEVIDGQHRLYVARELGLSVSVINIGDQDLSETISINTSGESWTSKDFLESYSSRGIVPYSKIKAFVEEYEFMSLSQSVYAMKGASSTVAFKEGNITISKKELSIAVDVAMYMAQFMCVHKKLRSNSYLQRAIRSMIVNSIKWDHERLIKNAMEKQPKLLRLPSIHHQVVRILE